MSTSVNATFSLDSSAVAALNDASGPVGEGTRRASERTAERARSAVDARGLVDTGRMRSSIGFDTEATAQGVTGRVFADVAYAIYHHQFLTDALDQLTPGDFT